MTRQMKTQPQSTPSRPVVITVRDLQMNFGSPGGDQIRVLQHIDADIFRGEFVCIVGPSGCGKTTLLNIIGGFLKATQGEVRIDSELVNGPDPGRIFIFQNFQCSISDAIAQAVIKARKGFIHQHDTRLWRQCAGKGDALLLAP